MLAWDRQRDEGGVDGFTLQGMEVLRRNALALLVLAAVVASFVVGRVDAELQSDQERVEQIANCERSDRHTATTAAYQRRTVANARTPRIAGSYAAFSRSSADNLAVADYIGDPLRATRVHFIKRTDESSPPRVILTQESKRLINAGCEQAFTD